MDIVEFAEQIIGVELLEHQKRLLKAVSALPKGSRVVMGRHGPVLLDKHGNVIKRD